MSDPIPFSFKCDAKWDDMLGDGGRRLCTRCNEQVVDLSSLTKPEADAVLATPGVCVSYLVSDGKVAYASEPRASRVDGQAARAGARQRSRRRKLLRFAAAAASGLVGGAAHAGSAPVESDTSTWTQVKDWVASWFDSDSCAGGERLAGEPMPVDTGVAAPPPPIRMGGAPMPVEPPLATPVSVTMPQELGFVQAELRCEAWRERVPVVMGAARFSHVQMPAGTLCVVTFKPGDVKVETTVGAEVVCSAGDDGITCE